MMQRGINPFTGEPFQDQEEVDMVWDSAYQHTEGAYQTRFDKRWEAEHGEEEGEDDGVDWE